VIRSEFFHAKGGADATEQAGLARLEVGRELAEMAAVAGDIERGKAVVVAEGEQFGTEQCGRNLVEVPLGCGGVEGSVAVVVAGAEEVAGE
jgi:hypothetical protein